MISRLGDISDVSSAAYVILRLNDTLACRAVVACMVLRLSDTLACLIGVACVISRLGDILAY